MIRKAVGWFKEDPMLLVIVAILISSAILLWGAKDEPLRIGFTIEIKASSK